jgi:hypothetical protein
MKKRIIIGISTAALLSLGFAGSVQAQHHHGGGHHSSAHRSGSHHSSGHHRSGHHRHNRHHHHRGYFGFYGSPFYTSYLGYYGAYQPYYYGSRLYRGPRYSDGSINIAVQSELARRGYYRGPIDGVIGQGTRRAIRAFQYDEGLPASGWIDGRLLSELRLI